MSAKKTKISEIVFAGYMIVIVAGTFLIACSGRVDQERDNTTKFQQYYRQGEQLYLKHCSNCHQVKGTGLGRVFPPLNKSDYMEQHLKDVICLIRYGMEGDILVNGETFNQGMKGLPSLTDLEIAEIATYIYNTWEHKKGLIDVQQVTSSLKKCHLDDSF